MRVFFILLPLLFTLASCSGGKSTKTSFEINFSGIAVANPTSYGGLVVYGVNTQDATKRFASVVQNTAGSATGSVTIDLPKNTVWKFGALAWMGTEAFNGEIRCAFVTTPIGATDTTTVSLSLTNQRCFDSDVAVSSSYNGSALKIFNRVISSFCEGDISTRTSTGCDYTPTLRPIEKGFAGSYRFIVKGESGDPLVSKCFRAGTDDEPSVSPTYTTAGTNIPAFLPEVGSPISVEAFLADDCSATKGSVTRSLANPAEAKIAYKMSMDNYLHVRTSAVDLCSKSDAVKTLTSPASGNGKLSAPFLICNEEQLFSVQKNFNAAGMFGFSMVKDSVYVLGRDMFLLRLANLGLGSTPPSNCQKPGDTLLPIGFNYDGACVVTKIPTGNNFKFDGNGHTINHFRFKDNNQTQVGFISQLFGDIYDVNFNMSEVEGGDMTGIVVGYKDNGGLMKKIKVTRSYVRGEQWTGGIIGKATGSPMLQLLTAEDLEVEGKSYTGGLLGYINIGGITDSSFQGSVYASDNSTNVGGIVGYASQSVDRVAASGIVRGNATFMGGIAGYASTVSFARSEVYIKDYNGSSSGARNFGGIAGQTTSVSKSYFHGYIESNCNGPGCVSGNLSGTSGVGADAFSTTLGHGWGGDDGLANYDVDTMFASNGLANGMCNGMVGCPWTQTAGDRPRLSNLEMNPGEMPVCAQTPNYLAFDSQLAQQPSRGSQANPFVICRQGQLADMSTYPGKYFVVKADVHLGSLTNSFGTFYGKLNGDGHIFHSYRDPSAATDKAFFDDIAAASEVKNLQLAGFSYSSSCGSCQFAGLTLANHGKIDTVRVQDIKVDVLNYNSKIGGLVTLNSGTIVNSKVNGNMRAYNQVGGLVFSNAGTISMSTSDAYIDGNGMTGTTNFFGGIAGVSTGVITQTRFRGEIRGVDYSQYVGGIAGSISATAVVTSNEVADGGKIISGLNSQSVGGIVGYAAVGSTVQRNLFNAVFDVPNGPTYTTKAAIIGDDAGAMKGYNLKLRVPQGYIESAASNTLIGYNPTTKACDVTLSRTSGNSGLTVQGMVRTMGNFNYYFGTLIDNGTTYTFSTLADDTSECNSLTSSVDIYTPLENADLINIGALKNPGGWDIADMTDKNSAEAARAYKAYKSLLLGEVPVSPPVWLYEPDQDGLKLFNND